MSPIEAFSPQDQEDAAWRAFVMELADHLAGQWPAMLDKLGDRYAAFVDLAVQQALERGLSDAAQVARFANLWFVWGPAYHDKPGYDWARELLARAATHEALAVHQLVRRSMAELARIPGTRIEPATLDSADERIARRFGALGRHGSLRQRSEPPPAIARHACDLEAAELRRLDDSSLPGQTLYRYEPVAGAWQRVPLPTPAPLRIQPGRPCPAALSAVSPSGGSASPGRLALRLRSHAVCAGDRHTAFSVIGPHGAWRWTGAEARALDWPVLTRDLPIHADTAVAPMAELTSPELYRLAIDHCGLRDEGDALGAQQALLSVWPAEPWLQVIERQPAEAAPLRLGGRAKPARTTRYRLERDGQTQDVGSAALQAAFEQGLDAVVERGLAALFDAWCQLDGLSQPTGAAGLDLLIGQARCSWGWQAPRLDAPAFMGVQTQVDLTAGRAALELAGEWLVAGSRNRLSLRVQGQSALQFDLRRDADSPALDALLLPQVARWRWPVELELEPLADASLALAALAVQPAAAALVGEAGLRPATHGRSGSEWFARLTLEPVQATLQVQHALLGTQVIDCPLLPALTLVDWSAA